MTSNKPDIVAYGLVWTRVLIIALSWTLCKNSPHVTLCATTGPHHRLHMDVWQEVLGRSRFAKPAAHREQHYYDWPTHHGAEKTTGFLTLRFQL